MRLVEDQRVVLGQPAVALGLGKQDAVGHHLDVVSRVGLVGETHLEADEVAQLGAEFLRHPRRHRARRDPPRLGVADHPLHAAPQIEADLRQLRGFARTGFAADDHDLVVADGSGDVFALPADWQLFGKTDPGQAGAALLRRFDRTRYVGGELRAFGGYFLAVTGRLLERFQTRTQRATCAQHSAIDGVAQLAPSGSRWNEIRNSGNRTHRKIQWWCGWQ